MNKSYKMPIKNFMSYTPPVISTWMIISKNRNAIEITGAKQLKTIAGIFLFFIEQIIEISHKIGCAGIRYRSKGRPDNGVG